MLRRAFFAALLGSTCLTAHPAEAGPVVNFLAGIVTGVSTGVAAGAGISGAYAAGMTVGAAVSAFAATTAGSMLFSVGFASLASKILAPQVTPQKLKKNFAQELSYMEWAYGEVRKGGPYSFSAWSKSASPSNGLTAAKRRRHFGVALCANPIERVVAHYLDEWEVDIAGTAPDAVADVLWAFEDEQLLSGERVLYSHGGDVSSDGSRVLLIGQSDQTENGVWVTAPGAWSRPADFADAAIFPGTVVATRATLGTRASYHCAFDGGAVGAIAQVWARGYPHQGGKVSTGPVSEHFSIRVHDGTQTTADPVWLDIFDEVSGTDAFTGISYLGMSADRVGASNYATIYPNGLYTVAPAFRGENRILDPRTGLRGWSKNAALVIADVATRIYGKTVDWDAVAVEADVAEAQVENRNGVLQDRWTISTTITAGMTWEDARSHLMTCCDAFFFERTDGALGFYLGRYIEPTVTLTDADFISISPTDQPVGPDDVYSYAYRYTEPAARWSEEATGAVIVGSNPAGGRQEQSAYGIDSHNQAWRCAYRWAHVSRPRWSISGATKYIGRRLLGQRFFRLQLARPSINMTFEIQSLTRNSGGGSWSVEAVSVEAADFAPDALTLEPAPPTREVITTDDTVDVVTGLSGEVIEATGGIAQILWSWPEQSDDLTQRLRVRVGAEDWRSIDITEGETSYLMTGLIDGATYGAQIRNLTGSGRLSDWAPDEPITVVAVANSVAPAAVSDFAVTLTGSSALLSWTAPNDENYAAARIYRADGSTDFADADLIYTEHGAPSTSDDWTDVAPGVGTWSYWIIPINASGVGSAVSGPQTISIS